MCYGKAWERNESNPGAEQKYHESNLESSAEIFAAHFSSSAIHEAEAHEGPFGNEMADEARQLAISGDWVDGWSALGRRAAEDGEIRFVVRPAMRRWSDEA